jgi:hypothetical protein
MLRHHLNGRHHSQCTALTHPAKTARWGTIRRARRRFRSEIVPQGSAHSCQTQDIRTALLMRSPHKYPAVQKGIVLLRMAHSLSCRPPRSCHPRTECKHGSS